MELETENLIKIILGVLVFVVVVLGVYFFFKNHILDFFKNLTPEKQVPAKLFLSFLR